MFFLHIYLFIYQLEAITIKLRSPKINVALAQLYQKKGEDRSASTCYKEILKYMFIYLSVSTSIMILFRVFPMSISRNDSSQYQLSYKIVFLLVKSSFDFVFIFLQLKVSLVNDLYHATMNSLILLLVFNDKMIQFC